MGTCALVGRQIGIGNAREAKRISKILIAFSLFIDVLECCLLFFFKNHLVELIIKQKRLRSLARSTTTVLFASIACDFFQTVLCGTINAFGKQLQALQVNLVTYVVFVYPLAYYFAFVY